jgi:hypothetical protein
MERRRRLVLGALSALLLAGCQINGEPLREETRMLRMILVPSPHSGLDPASSEGLDRLSMLAGTRLVYLRPMSGGGHVLVTAEPVPLSRIEVILQRLAADPAIAYAEEDRRVTHQSPE